MQVYPFIHSDDESTAPADDLKICCAVDCPAQPVEWLWPGKIPIGKVTLLVGDPGSGKSLVALDIAARLSRAAEWPDDCGPLAPREEKRLAERDDHIPPSSTLILSAEDDLADTIRPRLDAAGADPRRVFVIPSIADLRHDFAQLRAAINRAPNCRLIIIDPVNAYVGPSDAHFQTVVRKVLAPLAELATEKRIAVLAIAHLRKNDGPAIHRAAGSMGFVAAARAVWTVCRDETNPGRRLLLPLKNNLSPAARGLAYTIRSTDPTSAAAIAWDSTPLSTSAEDALAPAAKKRGPEAVELQDAGEWLRRALAGGPQSASQLTEQATQFGFHERTLRRALRAIGGDAEKRGLLEGWWWSIPEALEPVCESAPGSAGGLQDPDATSITTPGGAGGCHAPFPKEPRATFNKGTPEKLVPFPETCPLPEFSDDPPAPPSLPDPLRISESIAALDRLRTGRFSGQFPSAPPHHHPETTEKPKPRPSKTGNPLLDELLASLLEPPPTPSPSPSGRGRG